MESNNSIKITVFVIGLISMVSGVYLTPEIMDAYRYQKFYDQGVVSPVDSGIGSLSYFGIPPSRIQASLSGF